MKRKQNNIIEDDILPIEKIITDLTDNNLPLLNARLANLSNLNLQQLKLLNDVLQTIDVKRRRRIIRRLYELAEDDICLGFDEIFKHCLRDEDEEVRNLSIEGLWENEETSLIEPLINLMEHDSSSKIQAAAALALGRFVMLAEHQKIAKENISRLSQLLLTTLANSSKPIDVRRRSLEAVAPLNLPRVKQAINDSYNNANPMLKVSAIYAMGKNCDPHWLPILLSELSASDFEMRYEGAVSCGELGEKVAIPYLIELINDDDADIQMASIQALGKIGGSEVREYLKKCINHQSEAIRQAAIQALHELEIISEPLYPQYIDYGELDD
jgi:HEAT repeat protein